MTTRKRLLSFVGAAALAASGLVASAGVPAANAATLDCAMVTSAVDASNRITHRYLDNAVVTGEKKSKVLAGTITALLSAYYEEVSGGSRVVSTLYAAGTRPRLLRIADLDSSDTLSVTALKSTYTHSFNVRHLANSGSYYVYGVSPTTGSLTQWTRYQSEPGKFSYGNPKVIAKYMTGLTSLTYAWTFKVDGEYRDFLLATTKSGALKQIQVPLLKPAYEKQVTLATSGFTGVKGVSTSFCNDNPRYLSFLAIDGSQARWYTLASQTAPSTTTLVDRGLIPGEHDWDLHAIS